ncbi:Beta-fructofuranosidase, insoluble isoenzyme 4 [Ananas comosus]|uniref:Beta-fructofuranosidase, insoluble isoenzyme 4 n=1 Tax=Ananas comosus TaxID=4615 RepID=A0A199UTI2_ANACO|nr:Beta-fructofuranosidase, insoluble isoenzyme 4 [Ananas comosus]
MAPLDLPSSRCAAVVVSFVFLFLYFSLFFENGEVEANQRVFLYPQSPKVNSIVSKQYRTAYHFQPPKNWINGPMYYKGIYHLFYQYNPNGSLWGNIIWGHSVSTDLINWIRLEPALDRTTPSDNNGCWSGSATILAPDSPVILYTGSDSSNRQVQNIAFPVNLTDPYLTKWTKPAYNPLIEPVGDLNSSEFRDPTTGWVGKDNLWRIAIGAELQGKGAAILYKSKDFVHWVRAKDPLHSSSASGMWECPDFYPVVAEGDGSETKYVLKMSLTETGMDYYMLGKYEEERDAFVPDNAVDDYRLWARIDFGKFYASKSFFDPQKHRRILYGWSSESDSASDDVAKGWAGIHLLQWPIEEVESLRKDEVHLQDIDLNTGAVFEVKELKEASQADVEAEFELYNLERAEPLDPNWLLDPQKLCEEQSASAPGGVGPFGLLLLASDDLVEHTAVYFKVYRSQNSYMVLMCSDQRRSSSRPGLYKPAYGGFLDVDLQKERKISLRTLIDHSVIESFGGGGRGCITARVYPEALCTGSTYLHAFNNGSTTVKILTLKAWNMRKAKINENISIRS